MRGGKVQIIEGKRGKIKGFIFRKTYIRSWYD